MWCVSSFCFFRTPPLPFSCQISSDFRQPLLICDCRLEWDIGTGYKLTSAKIRFAKNFFFSVSSSRCDITYFECQIDMEKNMSLFILITFKIYLSFLLQVSVISGVLLILVKMTTKNSVHNYSGAQLFQYVACKAVLILDYRGCY